MDKIKIVPVPPHCDGASNIESQALPYDAAAKGDLYAVLAEQLHALLDGEPGFLANAANTASLVYHSLPEVNWAGFYFLKGSELVLGPFQGKPACVRIAWGKGVCGRAAAERKTIVVPNVHEFPGHIACDCASNSEIVLPIIVGERLIGVLDLDSPTPGRFDEEDRDGLERVVRVFLEAIAKNLPAGGVVCD
jgi:L-methionine (R)-S-oxide reductase